MEIVMYHCSDSANEVINLIDSGVHNRLLFDILDSESISPNFKDYMYNLLNPKFKYSREQEINIAVTNFNEIFSKDEYNNYKPKERVTKMINNVNGAVSSVINVFSDICKKI